MTKTGKRILAIVSLVVVIFVVGCLLYTGNRLKGYPELSEYARGVYTAKDDTMVAFTDEQVWYGAGNGEIVLLEIVSYKEGVITMKKNEQTYTFIAIDETTLYDVGKEVFLIRRTSSG